MMPIGTRNYKNKRCVDGASIGEAPAESMTDDSHVEIDDLDDFAISDFNLEEIMNKYFARLAFVISKNRMDGEHPSKV